MGRVGQTIKEGGLELAEKKSYRMENYDPDNPKQDTIHNCIKYARRHLNPIIDWTNEEVWEFIREYDVPYCKLYDEGFHRLGCIGCPMATNREAEFERWPTYRKAYLKAFEKLLTVLDDEDKRTTWSTADDVMQWWLGTY